MRSLAIFCTIGFLALLIWIIYLANTRQQSLFFDVARATPYGDKIGHFFLFGILTLLANFSLGFKTIQLVRKPIYLGTLLVFILVLLEEISQSYIPSRTFGFSDILADILGILAFTFLGHYHLTHKKK